MIKRLLQKSQKGTSLIELIVYFSLLGIVLIIATDILISSGEFSLEAAAKNQPQDEARYVMNRLQYDIRRADGLLVPANPGDSSTSLWLTINGDDYVYVVSGSTVTVSINGQPLALTSNLASTPSQMNFTRLGNSGGKPTIQITFTLQSTKTPKGGPQPETFETVVSLR